MKPTPVHNFGDLAFTPSVRATQTREGSRVAYARLEGVDHHVVLTGEERAFIAARDSFYMASVGENGWPYVQHRGGPAGFLTLLDERTLGFADFQGNRQYVSTGNVMDNHRVCLFLMDYPNRYRLKIWAEATVTADAQTLARLRPEGVPEALVERGFLLRVLAFDWNCSKYITPRYTEEEFEAMAEPTASPGKIQA